MRHSYSVLRGLTSESGGMVAAATTSLPERAEEGRNYDHRYVWIRDACLAGQAGAVAGGYPMLDDAVRFVSARLHQDGARMAPAYTVAGGPLPDQRTLDLPGYPGGFNRVGNRVNRQFQLDAFGEALLLFAAALREDRLDADGRRAVHLADDLLADTAATSLHPTGRWQRAPDDPGVDGALLLPPLRGLLPADDPRTVRTLDAYRRDLTRDHYAYRFRHDERPPEDAEGAFLLCGYMTALAEHQQGNRAEALRWFERNRAACGPPGLFTEEYDISKRQLRGNLPQAFVHALMLETATRLA
ncbi:glycoside hydrolase family 15 protein [Streptomyces synnematoformans]|uniref:GH15-like domain-containing protein n=1 Tax=Streptomyces synnematoformans TaxID=415721 RepID=A0ABN2Z8S8_9ACTN